MRLSVRRDRGRTALTSLRQSGSLKCLFPRRTGPHVEAMLINTAGGVTGGDIVQTEATADRDATLTLTTQAAERIYRAEPGSAGRIATHLHVGTSARINWLPQETILFEGSRLSRRLAVYLTPTSRMLLVEPVVFGRHAMGETLRDVSFDDHIMVYSNDRLLYADRTRVSGDAVQHLGRIATAGGAGAMATVIYAAPDAEALLPVIRQDLPDTAGASLRDDGVLVFRLLAPDGWALRSVLIPVLHTLCPEGLPRSWML